MGLRTYFEDIKTQLLTVATIQTVRMWNNQVARLLADPEKRSEMLPFPAAFVHFLPSTIMQLGEGVQLYDPLEIELHIVHWQLDAADGNFDQNLDVLDFAQSVFQKMQKHKAGLSGNMIRIGEVHDIDHPGLYHFVQRYRSTYVDDTMQEPVNGIDANTPFGLEIDLTIDQSSDPDAPQIYLFGPPLTPSNWVNSAGDRISDLENNEVIL